MNDLEREMRQLRVVAVLIPIILISGCAPAVPIIEEVAVEVAEQAIVDTAQAIEKKSDGSKN